ncbi:MAG: hypothetical protein J6T55_04565 [Alphaproteobacteria bacterium]|nr:hypothetical protein [Alphaproteobacteria bacterium]
MERKTNECPINCPFLEIRSYLPNSLPFYCSKYENYLGMTPAKKVIQCPLCKNKSINIEETGLELLETTSLHTAELKKAFLGLRQGDQQKVVTILTQAGIQIKWPHNRPITPINFLAEITRLAYEKKKREQSSEVQEFLNLLDIIGTDDAPISPATKTLLSNLFQVLDNSEKGMLLAILENPERASALLNALNKIPHNQNLLKNFRFLLYDMDPKTKESLQGNRLLSVEQGKALTLSQHLHLQHLMHLMVQARSKGREKS